MAHTGAMNTEGINIWVLGDYGPFSREGKSIGYLISVRGKNFLVDCGSPLFNQIGGHGLKSVSGQIITHCHDDHKRWFSDLALFHLYAPDFKRKLFLLCGEDVLKELKSASSSAVDRSLSPDSLRVVDIPFETYCDTRVLGPRARYVIERYDNADCTFGYRVVDREGAALPPQRAKVIINPKTLRPRMLFRDPETSLWVEPESFYSYSCDDFYEARKGEYKGEGFTLRAHKAPVWHGIPGIGVEFETDTGDRLFFTSDTVHDLDLWERLSTERLTQNLGDLSPEAFETASVLFGDINDFIEQQWSRQRFEEAHRPFQDAFVVQDASLRNSVVHTDYVRLHRTLLNRQRAMLTHCPDRMTSQWILCYTGKNYRVVGNEFYEVVDDTLYHLNADIYHKEMGKYYVGYRREGGAFGVYDNNGEIQIFLGGFIEGKPVGQHIFDVDLFEDVGGHYLPLLTAPGEKYVLRKDGQVERVQRTETGSRGTVVRCMREALSAEKVLHKQN